MVDSPQSGHITMSGEQPNPKEFWRSFGFEPEGNAMFDLRCTLPPGVIVIAAEAEHLDALINVAKAIGRPTLRIVVKGRRQEIYRVDTAFDPANAIMPDGVTLLGAGDSIPLSDGIDFTPGSYRFASLSDLPSLTRQDLAKGIQLKGYLPVIDSPLAKFSLRGMSEQLGREAVKAEPLLGDIALSGQATVLFAPPNAGKTLVVLTLLGEAVAQGRINPENVYYINADDSSEGLAVKLGLMDDLGVHTLAPGHKGFQAFKLVELFHAIADADKARGTLVIIDTVKKAVSLMDKSKAAEFTNACRTFVMKGGAIVGLGHTNKLPSASGKLQYSGTTDVLDDFDAAYIATPIEPEGFDGEKVVSFDRIKARGANAQTVAFAYADAPDVSYVERLASVRRLEPKELEGFRRTVVEKADAEVVAAIEACIAGGDFAKMALAAEVAKRTGISKRAAMRVIEAHSGTDPAAHKWTFVRKDRGAMIYTLLPKPEEVSEPLAA